MYEIIRMDNRIRIVLEKIPYVKSLSVGLWIDTGSRNETQSNNGVSHFIEHMLFKGTKNRGAKQIAEEIDNIGGTINAFTSKEATCYYTKTLDIHCDKAIDILSDMYLNSIFSDEDIENERQIILSEIDMYEDSPEELAADLIIESVWKNDSVGYPILGTRDSVSKINRNTLSAYMDEFYTPDRLVISIAGNFERDKILDLIYKKFSGMEFKERPAINHKRPDYKPVQIYRNKNMEQVHMCLSLNGIERDDDRIFPFMTANNVFGSGMSSRLYQSMREEKGLAYMLYTSHSSYRKAGIYTFHASAGPENVEEILKTLNEEAALLKEKGLTCEELNRGKNQLKGNLILGMENVHSIMQSNGRYLLNKDSIRTLDDTLNKIDDVTEQGILDTVRAVFKSKNLAIVMVGNIKKEYILSDIFNF